MPSNEPTAPPPLLDALAVGPVAPAALACLWAALLWAGTQVPQAWAPLAHTDGASRADLLAIAGMGLHRVAGSLPTWLLTASTLVVVVARALRRPADAVSADRLAALEARLGKVVARSTWRRSSDGRALFLGPARAVRWLCSAGVLTLLTAWLVHGHAPAPTLLETDATGQVAAVELDAGRVAPSGGVSGRCRPQAGGLTCTLAGSTAGLSGLQGQVALSPGSPATIGQRSLTWVGRRAAHTVDHGRLRWLRAGPGAAPDDAAVSATGATWYAFALPVGKGVSVPSLKAHVSLVDGKRAGPLVIASAGRAVSVGAAAGVVVGAPSMRLEGPTAARLVLGDDHARWLWFVGGLLLLVALVLWAQGPVAVVRITTRGARLASSNGRCSEASVLRAIALWQEEA